jgi:hypothetical protein
MLRYKFVSPPYDQNDQENEKFEQIIHNFEPLIHYVIEEKVAIQYIKMSRGVEPILVTR